MGPAAGSINAVLQAGWLPSRPDLWHTSDGTQIKIGNKPFSRFQLIARAQEDLQRQVWVKASNHQHGKGLETGIPSFEAVRKAIKYLGKEGFHIEARALEYVMVGFFRDPGEEESGHMTSCKRCGKKARATMYRHTNARTMRTSPQTSSKPQAPY